MFNSRHFRRNWDICVSIRNHFCSIIFKTALNYTNTCLTCSNLRKCKLGNFYDKINQEKRGRTLGKNRLRYTCIYIMSNCFFLSKRFIQEFPQEDNNLKVGNEKPLYWGVLYNVIFLFSMYFQIYNMARLFTENCIFLIIISSCSFRPFYESFKFQCGLWIYEMVNSWKSAKDKNIMTKFFLQYTGAELWHTHRTTHELQPSVLTQWGIDQHRLRILRNFGFCKSKNLLRIWL